MTCIKKLLVFFGLILVASSASALDPRVWVGQYYHADLNQYRLAVGEAGKIEAEADGYKSVGGFNAYWAELEGQLPACQFYSQASQSWFFGMGGECSMIQSIPSLASYWHLQTPTAFYADPVIKDGEKWVCQYGTPLYRVYNNGRNGRHNHFYTTDEHLYEYMIKTWGVGEGASMCVEGVPQNWEAPAQRGSAGEIETFSSSQKIRFNLDGGKYFGLADAHASYNVNPADIAQACYNSNRTGWMQDSRACASIGADHTATLPKTCNNDEGQWSVQLKDGRWLWFDHTSPEAWTRGGIASSVLPNGLVAYGKNGYQPSKVRTEPATKSVVIDFGSNCLMGFSKPLDPGDLLFVWISDKVGWGITNEWKPSRVWSFLSWDVAEEKFLVRFDNMAEMTDEGTFTVYKPKMGPGQTTIWEPGTDGFGYAWFAVPPAGEKNPLWVNDPGITWDTTNSTIQYNLAVQHNN